MALILKMTGDTGKTEKREKCLDYLRRNKVDAGLMSHASGRSFFLPGIHTRGSPVKRIPPRPVKLSSMEHIMLCLYDFFFLLRFRLRLFSRFFFSLGCCFLISAAEISQEADDDPQDDTQGGPGERLEECVEYECGCLAERHPVHHLRQMECRIEITEYEVARKNPENDPGCGADFFTPEKPPEKADDLLKHVAFILRVIKGNRGRSSPPLQILSCFREEYNN